MSPDQACDMAISYMRAATAAFDGNKGNCDAVATALEKAVADHKAFFEWGKRHEKEVEDKAFYEDRCEPRAEETLDRLIKAELDSGECRTDPRVEAAQKPK